MRTWKYFYEHDVLEHVHATRNERFLAIGGVMSRHNSYDSFNRMVGRDHAGILRPVTRKVIYKVNGTRHKCDSRCQNAEGYNCECSCMGKNHGASA